MNRKKLTRDLSDKWLAGVCSGIARYFDIDPLWVRLLCIVLFFAGAVYTAIIYILLALMLPVSDEAYDYVPEHADVTVNPDEHTDNSNLFLGIFLILTGLIFLFDKFFEWINWREFWPVLLIFLGLYIILKSLKEAKESEEPFVGESGATVDENENKSGHDEPNDKNL